MTRLLPVILFLLCLAAPLQGQESDVAADADNADAAAVPVGAADGQQADNATADGEDSDNPDNGDAADDADNADLDEQTYDEDDDDFTPSEEIPADEAIPFPTNI